MLLSSTESGSRRSHSDPHSNNHYLSLRDVDSHSILKSLDKECDRKTKVFPGFTAMELLTCETSAKNTASESDRSNMVYTKPTAKILQDLNEQSLTPLLRAFIEEGPNNNKRFGQHFKDEKLKDCERNTNDSDDFSLEGPLPVHPLDEPRISQSPTRRPSLDSTRALPSLYREDILNDRNFESKRESNPSNR
mmetsp:Transcript_6441/g.9489  ORF Transcript_6441/g.9489 Transcript_6441/m.9489 type:complete len:192 (-) Transcript_6441:12-587(-)